MQSFLKIPLESIFTVKGFELLLKGRSPFEQPALTKTRYIDDYIVYHHDIESIVIDCLLNRLHMTIPSYTSFL